jgi:hypothetical protein
VEAPGRKTDKLLRKAIREKRLVEFVFKGKPRVVEPHDYGIHRGEAKLFGYQVGGPSSEPLPNWRWSMVNSISDLRLLKERFPGRRSILSGKHHQWDEIWARVEPPEKASAPNARPTPARGEPPDLFGPENGEQFAHGS